MSEPRQSLHGEWSSRWIFIFAAAGSAVGLGNIWKFPYIVGENGGGAFVLMYLLFIIAIGVPLMMSEILIGRRGRRNPADSVRALSEESQRSKFWQITGWFGIISGIIVMFYYGVIAGWGLDYVFKAAVGTFDGASPAAISQLFDTMITEPFRVMFWNVVIIAASVFVIIGGVKKGLETALRFMFPAMLILLLIAVVYAVYSGAFMTGLNFLFSPDFSQLTAQGALIALGHAFFTLSLGQGAIMMYGAYLPKRVSIPRTILLIAGLDTFIALLAGLAIFPIVFAHGLPAASGPGLLFKTLPIAFGQMPYGSLFATLFFVMIVFAAFTSAIALIEPAVAWLIERFAVSRKRAALLVGGLITVGSLGSVLSFSHPQTFQIGGLSYFDFTDQLTANTFLPLGGLITAVFVGWMMRREAVRDELGMMANFWFQAWQFALRFIVPLAVIIVFINAIGLV